MNNNQLTDSCPMPFGRHMDKEMQDVPAAYLLFLWGEHKTKFESGEIPKDKPLLRVMLYIEDNLQGLNKELNQKLKR